MQKHVDAMPAPKKGAVKKKAAEPKPADVPAEEGAPKPKKVKKPAAPMMPVYDPLPEPENQSVEAALRQSVGWSNANNISKKFSVGTLTTTAFDQKVETFEKMNMLAEEKSSVLPMSNFLNRY